MPERGYCLKCHKKSLLTKHHIYPLAHYKGEQDSELARFCASCHLELEEVIKSEEGTKKGKRFRLSKDDYVQIIFKFLRGGYDENND
jgi:hypothetical protein